MNKKKTKSELLSEFKRANKERREKLAIREGFKNASEYLAYLEGKKKNTTKKNTIKAKPTIHNVFIMDDSGSMSGQKYLNGVAGIQQLVQSIKEDTITNNTITIVDLNRGRQYWLSNPSNVYYNHHTRLGGTPLYITLGKTITSLLEDIKSTDDKVLLNITTDGQDTDGFGNYRHLPQMIQDIQKNNNFTVTFIGTKEDVELSIYKLNIDRSNTLVHDNTAIGMKMSFDSTVRSRTLYSSNVSKGIDVLTGFYKQEETL